MNRRFSNKKIYEKIIEIQKDGKKARSLGIATIGVALIAITVPLIINLTALPEYAQWFVVAVYFGTGIYIIFSEIRKLRKES